MSRPQVRASYREAVEWIAMNDEPTWTDPDDVATLISTSLVAALWRKEREVVARAVVRVRRVERELEDRMQAPHDCD